MKSLKYIFIIFLSGIFVSCEKHFIEFESDPIPTGSAEFQLHYFVPLIAKDSNNIHRVEINNTTFSSFSTGTLFTFNAVPSGGIGRFFNVPVGSNNIKLFMGPQLDPVYDRDVTLIPGKQNVFIHDFNEDPIVIDNGFPYPSKTTEFSGKFAWVRFFNFLYDTVGEPTDKIIQYQYQYVKDRATMERSEWLNLGDPVAFGETTGWQEVPVIKEVVANPDAGSARIDYRIMVIGAGGVEEGILQIKNASGNMVNYSDWWNAGVGRHYNHIFGGYRLSNQPGAAVRLFTSN